MKVTLLMLGLLMSLDLSAGVYKCIDAKGNKTYKSIPCEGNENKIELNVKTGSKTDLDAVENQQELTEKQREEKEAQEKLAAEEKQKQHDALVQSAKDESAKNQFHIKSNPNKFSPFAIPPYKPEDLPVYVKEYAGRLPDVERLRREAADKALATGECGRVESVELSDKSNKDSLVILVDCSSAKKYYIAEQELKH
jgi:tyrosyl-tRNA synthetase